jgi:GTPase
VWIVSFEVSSFIDLKKKGDRGLLIYVHLVEGGYAQDISEFCGLAQAANIQQAHVVELNRKIPTPKYFIGRGQAEQVAQDLLTYDANVVLINHEVSAAQGRNLEQLFGCRVIDRNELILDIFAQRARSFEGKLQVELAQLQHIRTRLIRGWTHLERQRGGIGLRGPGETQLETDRRLLDQRIKTIRRKLDKVFKQRSIGRRHRRRSGLPVVSCVGYTNAGKSTLFNQLSCASVEVKDMLFATLDPTLRVVKLATSGQVVLADTVGFIRDLPHDLVAAFRATLEETRQADLLLHVVDSSHDEIREVMASVDSVLNEIEASDIPVLFVYNKIDLIDKSPLIERNEEGLPKKVWLSAKTDHGVDLLKLAIDEILSKDFINISVMLKSSESKLRAKLYSIGAVEFENVTEEGAFCLQLRISRVRYNQLFN